MGVTCGSALSPRIHTHEFDHLFAPSWLLSRSQLRFRGERWEVFDNGVVGIEETTVLILKCFSFVRRFVHDLIYETPAAEQDGALAPAVAFMHNQCPLSFCTAPNLRSTKRHIPRCNSRNALSSRAYAKIKPIPETRLRHD